MHQAVLIPASAIGAGGYASVNYEWSQSCTAGTVTGSTFFMSMNGITLGPAVTIPAANRSYRGNLRIRNINNSSQLVTVAHLDGTAGAALQTTSFNFNIDQTLRFQAYHNEVGTNTIALKGWNVEAHKLSATAGTALIPGTKIFWGMNHHFTYGATPSNATMISAMKALKINMLRVDWYGRSHSVGGIDNTTWIRDLASAMQADGNNCTMDLLVGCGPYSSGSAVWASETAAYNFWYDQGSYIAAIVKPLGVIIFESGNEIDADQKIRPSTGNQGTARSDYGLTADSAVWVAARGALRGVYDGIKSVHPTAQVGSNAFTNASIWASDCWWDGVNALDGTTGGNQVRWDWTNWHLYTGTDARDNSFTALTGNEAGFDLLRYLKNAYGRPVMITEWHPAQSTTASNIAAINTILTSWYSAQDTLNLAGAIFYDWFDAPFGMGTDSTQPTLLNDVGTTLVAFHSSHPALK
jgi:hypothetical protein